MSRIAGSAALLLLAGCSGADVAAAAVSEERAAATAEWMADGLRSGALRPACGPGGGSPGETSPELLAYVNARQSMSCRDLGFLLRRLSSERTWIVVPASDTATVCGFLARERIRIPALVHEGASEAVRGSPIVTVAGVEGPRAPPAVFHGSQGAVVLSQIPQVQ
ncbi:MAG TPA: hypothetical protein VFR81_19430 [Longimicrobium sp.]|nr:hypothetical protein [Longimicrobium sp.]